MDPKIKEAILRQVEKEPFAKKFGLSLLELDEGFSRVEMKFTADMEDIFGMAHGGALFALMMRHWKRRPTPMAPSLWR